MIYETIYLPFENNLEGKPWKYSGSDLHDNPKYFGSPCDMRVLPWTDGLSVRKWWKREVKEHPDRFRKTTLVAVSPGFVDRHSIKVLESKIQQAEDHAGNGIYFNRTNRKQGSWIISRKGITLEQMMGFEKAAALKRIRRDAMLGRTVSEETRARISASRIGMSALNKGVPMTEEQKKLLSEVKKGRETWNKGLTGIYGDDTIAAIKNGRAKQNMGMWVTNGEKNLKVYDGEIPEGFQKGRTMSSGIKNARSKQNMGMWITDGLVSIKVYDGKIAEGFRKGRVNVRKTK